MNDNYEWLYGSLWSALPQWSFMVFYCCVFFWLFGRIACSSKYWLCGSTKEFRRPSLIAGLKLGPNRARPNKNTYFSGPLSGLGFRSQLLGRVASCGAYSQSIHARANGIPLCDLMSCVINADFLFFSCPVQIQRGWTYFRIWIRSLLKVLSQLNERMERMKKGIASDSIYPFVPNRWSVVVRWCSFGCIQNKYWANVSFYYKRCFDLPMYFDVGIYSAVQFIHLYSSASCELNFRRIRIEGFSPGFYCCGQR